MYGNPITIPDVKQLLRSNSQPFGGCSFVKISILTLNEIIEIMSPQTMSLCKSKLKQTYLDLEE